MVLSECTREKVVFFKHAFTTMYKVESGEGKKTKKQEVFFFSFSFFVASVRDLEAKRLGGGEGGWGVRTVLIVGHVQWCPIGFLALMDKMPSSPLDHQLKGKQKRDVRRENHSTHSHTYFSFEKTAM